MGYPESHAFAFHNKPQGATNIPCDEVLTVPPWGQLRVRKSVLCRTQPLTVFCTYLLTQEIVWVSARTSVTTALMSMAMLSTLKVFFMMKKEGKEYDTKQRRKGSGRTSN